MGRLTGILFVLIISWADAYAQCSTAQGDQVAYGAGSWIGYVYDGVNNFDSDDYQGYVTEVERFDQDFGGNSATFAVNGCDLTADTYTIRYKMRQTFTCGAYDITVGGDDGVRLSLDGGATFIIDAYFLQVYKTYTERVFLDGTYDLVLEYYENNGENRVSFDYSYAGNVYAGKISGDQTFCGNTTIDPSVFTSVSDAVFCGSPVTYQWQSSTDNVTFSNIPGANSATYDAPAGLTQTTYYQRQATDGITTLTSNVITVTVNTPTGDEVSYGAGSWIGYVYDGTDNYSSSDYHGFITETETFDENFGGGYTTSPVNGCDIYTETFTVRFKMQKTFACGVYDVTIGGDDGVRLSIDGGATYVIDGYVLQPYRTYTERIALDGTYELVLEYYEKSGANRVSFDYAYVGSSFAGSIAGDQSYCGNSVVDPTVLASRQNALICGSTISYQWQSSTDNVNFSNITGANSASYDPPAGLSQTTYYQRLATDGSITLTSNVVTVEVTLPAGDQTSYGPGSWIGYVYDGVNNFSSSAYHGFMTENETFDETFGGSRVTMTPNGCDIYTETFSVRFKMQRNFAAGDYTFTVGADDGVRLSLDGGSTYIIDDYGDHGYRTNSATVNLNGTYDLVLDYYENGGGNRVSFDFTSLVLPVELLGFEGYYEDSSTKLNWSTATEQNNDYFEVQHSINGKDYQVIGEVNGAGNSVSIIDYTFEDRYPKAGINYYRLRQVDYDGNFEYSPVISVVTVDEESLHFYPNPSKGLITLNFKGPAVERGSVSIYNASGIVIKTIELNGDFYNTQLDLSALERGQYILKFNINQAVFTKRLMIVD